MLSKNFMSSLLILIEHTGAPTDIKKLEFKDSKSEIPNKQL